MDTLDNTQAHCAQLHTNDKNRAEAYAALAANIRVALEIDRPSGNSGATN